MIMFRENNVFWTMPVVAFVLLFVFWSGNAQGSRVEFSPRGKQTIQFKYYNAGEKYEPTVSIFAITDRSREPFRHLSGVTLNGVRVINRMLTGSVLRINPDGSGMYMYNTGYLLERWAKPEWPLQNLNDVGRNMFDPEGQKVPGNKLYLLRNGKPVRLTYKLDFPAGVKIEEITLAETSFGLEEGTKVVSMLSTKPISDSSADPEQLSSGRLIKKVYHVISDGIVFRHKMSNIDTNQVYLTITAINPTAKLHLQGVTFWAKLKYPRPLGIVAKHGENVISYADDENSSHMGRIFLDGGKVRQKVVTLMDPFMPGLPEDPWEGMHVPVPTSYKPMKKVNPQDFFPMGFYQGPEPRHTNFMLKDMKEHNMNTWWVTNVSNHKNFLKFLKQAEARGIRLVYETGNLVRIPLQQAKNDIAPYRNQYSSAPNLLLWILAEEIDPATSKRAAPLYKYYRSIPGWPAPAILHNKHAAAQADADINKPLIITSDVYPFFDDSRAGPSSPRNIKNYYFRQLAGYYNLARKNGASYWIMPQAWSQAAQIKTTPPWFGASWRRPPLSAGMTKWQVWTAVAHGATGVIFFPYRWGGDGSWETLRKWDTGEETDMLRGAADAFGKLKKVGPILCRLERDYEDKKIAHASDGRILATSFKPRKGSGVTGHYLVLANNDWDNEVCFEMISARGKTPRWYDCIRGWDLPPAALKRMVLGPGDGTVIALEGKATYMKDLESTEE